MLATPAQADGKKHLVIITGKTRDATGTMIVPGITVVTGTIDLTIASTTATTIESLITTDRTIIAVQYSSFGSDRTKSASAERLRTRKCAV